MSEKLAKLWAVVPHIGFLWPDFLWLLLAVPLAVVFYVLLLKRRRKIALPYANMPLVRHAMGVTGWRRHVPPVLLLIALTFLLLAMARPTALVSLPSNRATVILAMDVSGSMRATDVKPSRLQAAQTAAKQFIKSQPSDVLIGIVAFAGSALLVQSPTTDHISLDKAIDRFRLQRATAVGSGILESLSTIFPKQKFPINNFGSRFRRGYGDDAYFRRFGGRALGDRAPTAAQNPKKHVPVEPGSYKNAVIVLLSDGQTNSGFDPIKAAHTAADYGVRVYTVGFGTDRGSVVGFGGFSMRTRLDEATLKKIADITRGRYFRAASAQDLKAVYDVLSKQLVMETKEMEITSFFAAAAAFMLLCAGGVSLAWFGRIL